MSYNKNDIEFYVLNKDYEDLTASELKLIQSEIKTEEAFNSMKQLLVNLKTTDNEEIEPAPALRASLIKDFEQARWKKGIGLDETPVVPLVEKKKEEKKNNKLMLWFSMAASVLLLIGLVYNKDNFFSPKPNQLALNETTKVEEKLTPKNIKTEVKKETKETVSNQDIEKELEQETEKELEQEIQNPTKSNNKSKVYSAPKNRIKEEYTEVPVAFNDFEDEALDSDVLAETKEEISTEMIFEKTVEATSLDEITEGLIAEMDLKMKDSPIDSESISLENDKDLIGLLYTAL